MATATVVGGQIRIPEEILSRVGLKDGDRVVLEAVGDRLLQIRPGPEDPDEALLKLLDEPFDLGVIEPLTREAIYEIASA